MNPEGFVCKDCGVAFPWVCSAREKQRLARCRYCESKMPYRRRQNARIAEKRRRCKTCKRFLHRGECMVFNECQRCHADHLKKKPLDKAQVSA